LADVRNAIDVTGDTFYTTSPSTGDRAEAYSDNCNIGGCIVETIRSTADEDADNNLDNLRECRPPR
jgi:hypothetical protein